MQRTVKKEIELNKVEMLMLGASIAFLFLLLFVIKDILSPFVIFGASVFLLYPLRASQLARNVLWLAAVLFFFWFLNVLGGVLVPFVVALLVAYILHPFVTRLENRGVPRWLSSLVIIVIAVAVVISTIVLVVPLAFQQFESIFLAMNGMVAQFTQWLVSAPMASFLARYGISGDQLHSFATENITKHIEDIFKELLQGTLGLFSGLSAIVSSIVNIVIIPFITFYFLKDFPLVKNRAILLFPKQQRGRVQLYYKYIDEVLGRYIRGTATIAFVDAVCITGMFWGIGIQYSLVLGIISGVLSFIPYFGFMTMLFLSAIVATLSPGHVFLHVVLALSTVAVMHIVETYVLSPRIIGGKIGLHPVLLILSLLTFSFFMGFIGLLIAIPAAAIIIVFIKEWDRTRTKESQIALILEDRIGEEELV